MAARRFRRRRSVEHGFAFVGVWRAATCLRRQHQPVIAAAVHIDQAAPIEHGDLGRLIFMPRQQRLEAAVAVARQNFREQGPTHQRRMAAIAAETRIDDGRWMRCGRAQQACDRRGTDQRHVDWRQQESVDFRRQRGDALPHAGEHAAGIIGIVGADDADTRQFGRQGVSLETGDDVDLAHPSGAQVRRNVSDQRSFAKRQ